MNDTIPCIVKSYTENSSQIHRHCSKFKSIFLAFAQLNRHLHEKKNEISLTYILRVKSKVSLSLATISAIIFWMPDCKSINVIEPTAPNCTHE